MLGSDRDIEQYLHSGQLGVDPYDPGLLQPASLDVRLDHRFACFAPIQVSDERWLTDRLPVIDPAVEQPGLMVHHEVAPGEAFELPSGGFALGATVEWVAVAADIAVKIEGCSSLGRLGLMVHATAGWIDPGWSGTITLELTNVAPFPVRLWPGMKIAQLAVMTLHTPARRPYGADGLGSHYQHQTGGPQVSRSWQNFKIWPTRQEAKVDV